MSKNWDIQENKLVIPETDLDLLDITKDGIKLEQDYNPSNAKGVYMTDMTEDDYIKWEQQKSGWAKFYDKILRLK